MRNRNFGQEKTILFKSLQFSIGKIIPAMHHPARLSAGAKARQTNFLFLDL
jgi:hypothetical protein